jgi:hypothetical protein
MLSLKNTWRDDTSRGCDTTHIITTTATSLRRLYANKCDAKVGMLFKVCMSASG